MMPSSAPRVWEWILPATIAQVEVVSLAVMSELQALALARKDIFALGLLLREALNNAVLHGCQQNPDLKVACRVELVERRVVIRVADEGPGFHWQASPDQTEGQLAESGRGMFIYFRYAQQVQFNQAGNCVTLTRILLQGENDE